MKFVHLHVHSHYSLLDGLTKIDELVEAAKNDGAEALALTDHGVMYGAVEFYQKCLKAGIKPIIGVEAYFTGTSRLDKNIKSEERNYHLILLAKNLAGYKNLIKLTTIAHLEGYYYKPRIDGEVLNKYKDGLIALTACLSGEIPRLIINGNLEKAEKRILELRELFGDGNFYLELQSHPELEYQDKINQQLIEFGKKLSVPVVATNDSHYLNKDDDEPQDVLLCLQTKKKKEDRDRLIMLGNDFSLRTAKNMTEVFKDTPEAIANTVKIAEQCNLELKLNEIQLPYFEVPAGDDGDSYLEKLAQQGIQARLGKSYDAAEPAVKDRLNYELEVIKKMGWSSYFLIVADFVNWAKGQKIVVGPGRGSAPGSLVSYLLNITNIDPLKYELLFERFLNPDRISMPDIDMDFADTRRDEVIRYVENKYGKDHVAQIITFGTMAARAAIRDVGRVLNFPYEVCDKLAKMVPMFSKIDQALNVVGELKEEYKNDEGVRKLIDYAKRLEGVARHASTHACAVIITKEPLNEYVPLQYASSSDRTIVSQYSMHPIEDLGILKIDFLGLKNLTIIESALKIIRNTRGLEINIDQLPLDDRLTYKLFQDGETTGVFQFESSGMKRYLRELKPTGFEDIIAMVALYRPGPMEWIPDYIAGKHAKKKPVYLHAKLQPILAKTYGVAIYQEQVMQIARDLAGFSMAEADVLRKAMGKKIAKLLNEQKEKFIDGCVKNGIPSELAGTIFTFIEPFAGYGFNRSHAACYAMIAYQTAYLKAHWPTEFMAALLTSDQQDIDRIAIEIDECRRMGIEVTSPDINQSFSTFTVVTSGTEKNLAVKAEETPKTIRFGLKAIKNIGEHIADVIIAERKAHGPYKDMTDFLERVNDKDLNKKSLESLIKCGGLDAFGERGQLLFNMDNLLNFNKEMNKSRSNGQVSLFSDSPMLAATQTIKLEPAPKAKQSEKLAWEKELLGLYISEHPFTEFKPFMNSQVTQMAELSKHLKDYQIIIAGVISKVQKIITRTNEAMLFVKLEDLSGSLEILVFPSLLKETSAIWQEGKIVLCQGKLSDKDQELKLLTNRAIELTADKAGEEVAKFTRNIANYANQANNANVTNNARYGKNPIESRFNPASSRTNGASAKLAAPVSFNSAKVQVNGENIYIILDNNLNPDILNKLKDLFTKNTGDKKVYFKIKTENKADQGNLIETEFKVSFNKALVEQIGKLVG